MAYAAAFSGTFCQKMAFYLNFLALRLNFQKSVFWPIFSKMEKTVDFFSEQPRYWAGNSEKWMAFTAGETFHIDRMWSLEFEPWKPKSVAEKIFGRGTS